MIAYLATKGRATVRILAYRPRLAAIPEDHLKVVIQATDHGQPIAEDPLVEETATPLDLARELHLMRNEGREMEWESAA